MKKPFKILLALFVLLLVFFAPVTAGALGDTPTHTVTLYDRGDPIAQITVPDGTPLKDLPTPTREGYRLVGWRVDTADGALFEPSIPITNDTALHAAYELLPPSFEISSLAFTYDGRAHTLAFFSLSHPLLDGGILSYEWYKDGAPIGAYGSSISLSYVSDSGEYSCRLVFSVGGDVTEITTPTVTVSISKCELPLPELAPLYYTGDAQTPPIYDNGYYTVDRTPHTLAGSYPVTLTLTDPDNYAFIGTDKPTAEVDMLILPAENFWIVTPAVSDVYTSFSPDPVGMSRFGTPRFLYSRDGVEYSDTAPTTPGSYFMRAEVAECENYSALISAPITFKVIAEEVVGIATKSPANKMTYRAFEEFDPTGLAVGVTYNSGRYEEIGAEMLAFSYQQAASFRYRDSGVIISYGGSSVLLRTTVLRADYDLSGIAFPDVAMTYNAAFISPTYIGTLPTGEDGIPLTATVTGGGVNVGTYPLILSFHTASDNYNAPTPIKATLTVEPYVATVTWCKTSFVYDGRLKLPEAYYLDVYGRKVVITPTGAHSFAGQYTATATTQDANYTLSNPTVEFEILKADYDMSGAMWQGGGEIYDGTQKRVCLVGLPSGVAVIGYANSSAINAGEYTATAALSYDSANYNPPIAPEYVWRVLPATYITDGFAFFDTTAVFDGEAHYPLFDGKMPTGIDGITLEYTFSSYATHVSEGRVAVEITFATKSTNYTAPSPLVRYVEITPRDIIVKWENAEFRYTGAPISPTATANECEITVSGASVNAGTYTALATSQDPDYKVENSTCTYVILKAANDWTAPLVMSDIFYGRTPDPTATAKAGEVRYTYYSDAECTTPLDTVPSAVGIYYVRAASQGDTNHEPIISTPVRFEIIAIAPVSLVVTLVTSEYTAFDTASFTAALLNNDGTYTAIDPGLVSVKYQSGDTMRYGDTRVTFSYADMTDIASITVAKRKIAIPEIDPVEYDGTPKAPPLAASDLYTAHFPSATVPGSYPVTLTLTDTENYTFLTSDSATVYFVIQPRRITVTVADVNLHLFENDVVFDWRITSGTLVGSDTLTPTFRIEGDRIFADFEAENYDVNVIPGSINRLITLSRRSTSLLFLFILILITVTLAIIAFLTTRRRFRCRVYTSAKPSAPVAQPPSVPTSAPEPASVATVVDAEYADNAITNSLAKDLIRRDDDVITDGSRHGIVNVDTLSRSFSAGDRVDINALKSHSLIPYDTAYIKVLARGIIDKPLYVYANDFSLSAVKMIALSGGKAVKVNSVIRKKNKE